MLHEIPPQNDVHKFDHIPIFVDPPRFMGVEYGEINSLDDYLKNGWTPDHVGTAPDRTQYIIFNLKYKLYIPMCSDFK